MVRNRAGRGLFRASRALLLAAAAAGCKDILDHETVTGSVTVTVR